MVGKQYKNDDDADDDTVSNGSTSRLSDALEHWCVLQPTNGDDIHGHGQIVNSKSYISGRIIKRILLPRR